MKTPTRILSFAPTTNAPGKNDVTGAFEPEQRSFTKSMRSVGAKSVEHRFDNTKPLAKRAQPVLDAIGKSDGFDTLALFCHGWLDGVQAGFTRRSVPTLAKAIRSKSPADVTIALYCCSTGADPNKHPLSAAGTGDDSFADRLRDALCGLGAVSCRVMGHSTAAHTTRNPYALFFEGMGSPVGGIGGIAPVPPKHPLWTSWRKALTTDLRFQFAFMDVAEIHTALLQNGNGANA